MGDGDVTDRCGSGASGRNNEVTEGGHTARNQKRAAKENGGSTMKVDPLRQRMGGVLIDGRRWLVTRWRTATY